MSNDNAGKMKTLLAGIKAVRQGEPNGVVSETKQDQPPPPATEAEKGKKGRAKGKRSSPDHTQVSAYIPIETNLKIKMALSEEALRNGDRKPREFSELITDLLAEWLSKQPPK